MYTIQQAATLKHCHTKTIRRAIKDSRFPIEILNPDDAPQRHVIRIPDTQAFRDWMPGTQYNRRIS